MKIIEFRGASDDTFGYQIRSQDGGRVVKADDHDDCANDTVRTFLVHSKATDTGVHVIGVYSKCPTGVWAIGLGLLEEGVDLPDWASRVDFRTEGYTPVLMLVAPDDATVELVQVDGKPYKKDEDK